MSVTLIPPIPRPVKLVNPDIALISLIGLPANSKSVKFVNPFNRLISLILFTPNSNEVTLVQYCIPSKFVIPFSLNLKAPFIPFNCLTVIAASEACPNCLFKAFFKLASGILTTSSSLDAA